MFTRDFHPTRFLRGVHGTEPFATYCRSRTIPFAPDSRRPPADEDVRRWDAALASLPAIPRTRVARELAWVNELGGLSIDIANGPAAGCNRCAAWRPAHR